MALAEPCLRLKPTATGVSVLRANVIPIWKPQSLIGFREYGLKEEPRGIGITLGLSQLSMLIQDLLTMC